MSDIPSDPSTTAALVLGGSLESRIDPERDIDLVRVELTAGQSYVFDMLGRASGLTLADPYLELLDAGLSVIASDDDSGLDLDASIAFTAATSGTYYLRAFAYDGTGSYRLTMNAPTPRIDDHGQSAASAGRLGADGTARGTIDFFGDRDWFRVNLLANQTYTFTASGADHGKGTLVDPHLSLYDAAGTLIGQNDDAGDGTLDSLITFTAHQSGDYYLDVSGFGDGTGSYTIAASGPLGEIPISRDQQMIGTGGHDTLVGTDGDDVFYASAGDDLLIGGGGSDTLIYSGLARSYVRNVSAGSGTVSGGPEGGTDTLNSIETLVFGDGYQTTDPNSHAAQVSRLYQLILERQSDSLGLNNWVHALDKGASLVAVADGFASSGEFQAKTGGLGNADFVEFLYNGALGRASDAAGKAGWVGALDAGALTRGQVIVGFSESAEYHGITDPHIGTGYFIYDETFAAVASLYDAFADRLPDAGGLLGWTSAAKSGVFTMEQIADGFAASAEFQGKIAGLDERGIVQMLYRNVLGREGEQAGVDGWTAKLSADHDVGSLLWEFARSTEHQVLMQPSLADGIVYL